MSAKAYNTFAILLLSTWLGLRQNGLHLPDNIFKLIFLLENYCILIQISLEFIPTGPIT